MREGNGGGRMGGGGMGEGIGRGGWNRREGTAELGRERWDEGGEWGR